MPSSCGACGSGDVYVVHKWSASSEAEEVVDCICGIDRPAGTRTIRTTLEGEMCGEVKSESDGFVEWDEEWPREGYPSSTTFESDDSDWEVECPECFHRRGAHCRRVESSDADTKPSEFFANCRACGDISRLDEERFGLELWELA